MSASIATTERRVAQGAQPVLEVRDISVSYKELRALDGVSLRAYPSETLGVIGPNGAGKSTLVNMIAGVVQGSGQVILNSAVLRPQAPHQRARAGIGRTFQTPQLFTALTAAENVLLAAKNLPPHRAPDQPGRASRQAVERAVEETLAAVGLSDRASVRVSSLSGGDRKLLELARTMVQRPQVLILDEPAAGIPALERAAMLATVKRYVRDSPNTCLLIEHDMELIANTCDWIYVLSHGRVIHEGTWQTVSQDPEVRRAYLGV
jgi:ABC-type branched-subunit amino acid transport system ATPase component